MNSQKHILIYGRLGKEPELMYTSKQTPVCHLAVAEDVKGQQKPNWHKVIVWGKQAETCKVMLQKGASVFISGHLSSNELIDQNGDPKKYLEIKATTVGLLMK